MARSTKRILWRRQTGGCSYMGRVFVSRKARHGARECETARLAMVCSTIRRRGEMAREGAIVWRKWRPCGKRRGGRRRRRRGRCDNRRIRIAGTVLSCYRTRTIVVLSWSVRCNRAIGAGHGDSGGRIVRPSERSVLGRAAATGGSKSDMN